MVWRTRTGFIYTGRLRPPSQAAAAPPPRRHHVAAPSPPGRHPAAGGPGKRAGGRMASRRWFSRTRSLQYNRIIPVRNATLFLSAGRRTTKTRDNILHPLSVFFFPFLYLYSLFFPLSHTIFLTPVRNRRRRPRRDFDLYRRLTTGMCRHTFWNAYRLVHNTRGPYKPGVFSIQIYLQPL